MDVLPNTLADFLTWDAKEWITSTQSYASYDGYKSRQRQRCDLGYAGKHDLGWTARFADTDGDGLGDGWEYQYSGFGVSATSADTDNDGLSDREEIFWAPPPTWPTPTLMASSTARKCAISTPPAPSPAAGQ